MIVHKVRQRYRYSFILLRQLVKADFKLRYQGSVLGYIWSLLRPLLLFATLYFVFTEFLKIGNDIPHKAQYLLLGIVLWNFFGEVTSGSVGAIVGKGDLIRKINFPKYNIVLAVSLSALINLGLNFIVVAIFMLIGRVPVSLQVFWMIPLIAELYIFALSLGFILSALFVRFRDVTYIWEVCMQAGFYGTPILYLLGRIPIKYGKIIILSPMSQIIQGARYVVVTHQTTTIMDIYPNRWIMWLVPLFITAALAVIGGWYFRSRSKHFAEDI